MRIIIGFLTGVLGLIAGWFGLAMLVIALAGEDRDGGIAMGAFFQIGPIGGVAGFILGVLLFIRFGQTRRVAAAAAGDAANSEAASAPIPARRRVAWPFALVVVLVCAGLSYWGWYVFIRSPYLTHGYMTLALQIKLPPGMALPAATDDVHITVDEGGQWTDVMFAPGWHGTDGGSKVILATATLSYKSYHRNVTFEMPGVALENWTLELPNDPDPMADFSPWKAANGTPSPPVLMNYQLTTDN